MWLACTIVWCNTQVRNYDELFTMILSSLATQPEVSLCFHVYFLFLSLLLLFGWDLRASWRRSTQSTITKTFHLLWADLILCCHSNWFLLLQLTEGVGQLLFEVCKGVPRQFHSCTETVISMCTWTLTLSEDAYNGSTLSWLDVLLMQVFRHVLCLTFIWGQGAWDPTLLST